MSHQSASNSSSSLLGTNTTESTADVRLAARMHAPRAPDGRTHGEDGKGSSPTNREPYNCNNEYFKLLRFGVDSLYLSYQGDLFPEVQERLTKLKQLAQHSEIDQQALAQYTIAGHIFEVKDKGAYSTLIRPPIPRASGHPVHGHPATDSTMIRPPWSGGGAR